MGEPGRFELWARTRLQADPAHLPQPSANEPLPLDPVRMFPEPLDGDHEFARGGFVAHPSSSPAR